jgi:DNA-directed RNA polymerase specialized sigma24 family protein
MNQQQPQNARGRDPTYGIRLDRISRGSNVPPGTVLEAETTRAYRIARRCRGLSHEDAEDFAQDYCLKIVEVWSRWDQERPLLPFLNTLLFRELVNHGRRRARASLRGRLMLGEFGEPDVDANSAIIPEPIGCLGIDGDPMAIDAEPGEVAIRREFLSLVKCDTNRAILELIIEGASVDEIVEVLDLPPGHQGHQRVWNGRDRGLKNIRDQTTAE